MAYIGSTPTTQSFISGTDYFNGTGSATAFTMSRSVASVNDIQAVVNNVVQVPNDAYTISGTTITFTSAPSAGTSNVYVRYLSTTTQAITPSQGTVSYNTLDSNMQSAISTGMKNRIINGAMVIDQRNAGASVTPSVLYSTYTLDRWEANYSVGSKFSVQQNAGSVTPPAGFTNYLGVTSLSNYAISAGEIFNLQYKIEGYNIADLGWGTANAKTVTLSFWVRSSLTGTFGGSLVNSGGNRSYPFSYTISSANTWEQKSVTIAGDTSGTWLTTNGIGLLLVFGLGVGSTYSGTAGSWSANNYYSATGAVSVVGTNGATFYITGVQLEVGSSATGFEYVNYQTSLANCQRYYYKLPIGSGNSRVLSGYNQSTTQSIYVLNMPVSMRTSPTALETSGTAAHYAIAFTNTETTCSAIPSYNDASVNTTSVIGTVASGLTAGQGCQLRYINASAYLAVSAEL
jgi:hypothetical protein